MTGGSIATRSVFQISNPVVLGLSPHSDHFVDLFHSSPKFKSTARLVNSQLLCLQQFAILNNVMFS